MDCLSKIQDLPHYFTLFITFNLPSSVLLTLLFASGFDWQLVVIGETHVLL